MRMSPEAYDDMIIKDYSAMLENPPKGYIHDTSLLPHPKGKILKALLLRVATASDPEYVNAASICALGLSHYQDGVGESIQTPIAGSPSVGEQLVGYDFERFRYFSELMRAEGEQTMKLIEGVKEVSPISRKSKQLPKDAASKKKGWRRFLGA